LLDSPAELEAAAEWCGIGGHALIIPDGRSKLLGFDNAPRPAEDSFITNKDQLIREIRLRTKAARLKLAAAALAQLPQESDGRDPAVSPTFSLSE
jgi:hypothetical protein